MNIYVWDVTEPLPYVDGFLCFADFAKTNTSFYLTLTDPLTGNTIKLYHNDSISLVDGDYVAAAFRESPLRVVFHKIIL